MTAVDFEKFIERLADVSGEAILPFFGPPSPQTTNPHAAFSIP